MRMTFSPQVGDSTTVQGLLLVGEDITEQATARRDSEQAERKLRLLAFTLNCAKDSFILTDLENHILYVNQDTAKKKCWEGTYGSYGPAASSSISRSTRGPKYRMAVGRES